MTNNNKESYIINQMAIQYPEWRVTSVSITPWGAYIYAEHKESGKTWTFSINL